MSFGIVRDTSIGFSSDSIERMKRTLASLVVILSLVMGTMTSVWAADYEKEWEAYSNKDYATALREFRPLAEQGDVDAQYNLGVMYEYGEGINQDYKEAVKWYRLAAEQGEATAQGNLGGMYGNGQGVIQDNVMAHMWLDIGASNGSTNAAKNRDIVAKRMNESQLAEAQKLARECVARNYKGC